MEMKMNYDSQPMDAAKAELMMRIVTTQAYLKKKEKSQMII